MKNSFAFYQGAAPGMSNFGARMAATAGRRGADEMAGMKDAAHMDLYEQQAELARGKAMEQAGQNSTLADTSGALSSLAGIAAPLAKKAEEYFRTGKLVYQPATPNDDEGNPIPSAETSGVPPELAASMPRLDRARQTLWATRAGGGNAEQLAKAQGEFQGQGITDQVQANIQRGGITNPIDLASTMNQGGKLGQKIDRFGIGAGGMTINDATGETVPGAANNKAVADLRAAMTAAGIDPEGPQAKVLFQQLATKMVTHPGLVPPSMQHITDAAGNLLAFDPKAGTARPVLGEGGEPIVGKDTTKEKALPTSAAQKMMENQQNLRRAEQALALIQGKMIGGATGDQNATGLKGYLGDTILQRVDKEGVDTRAAIADLGSLIIHDRSGAAVTAAEQPRLKPFIPQVTDDPATVKKKLEGFVRTYKALVGEAVDFYRESGYKVPDGALRGADGQPQGSRPAVSAPRAPTAPGGRPPLSSFESGGSGPMTAPRTQKTSAPPGQGRASKSDQVSIIQDEYDREAAYQPKDQADAFRKKVNLESLARELRALGVNVGGT